MAAYEHHVTLVFAGAVALGPPLPSSSTEDPTAPGPLFAVMPMTTRRKVKLGNIEDVLNVHLPVIFTRMRAEGPQPDDFYRGFGIWYPMRERLQVVVDGSSTPGTLQYVHTPGQDPMDAAANGDMAAVPHMRDISPGRRNVSAAKLQSNAAGVAAQVFVPSGTLRSGSLNDPEGDVIHFTPNETGHSSTHNMRAKPHVRVTVDVKQWLEIHANSLEDGAQLDPLRFRVTGDEQIWIGNLDPKDVRIFIDRLFGEEPAFHRLGRDCDFDFAFHFDVTDGAQLVSVPCSVQAGGERKCYVVMVDPPTP
jgi:hypothetical protein